MAFARPIASAGRKLLADANALVPTHWSRLFIHRFNQAAEFSRFIVILGGVPNELFALGRARRTAHSFSLIRAQILNNVSGTVRLAPGKRGWLKGFKCSNVNFS